MDAPLDPYLELAVPRTAYTSEITDAYHRLVRQYHPDGRLQGGDDKASEGPCSGSWRPTGSWKTRTARTTMTDTTMHPARGGASTCPGR